MKILLAWIGFTDLRASEGSLPDGLGPIGQAIESRSFDQILLLSDLEKNKNAVYKKWLASQTHTPIEIRTAKLTSPTEFGEIYKAVVEIISELEKTITLLICRLRFI